MTPIIYEGVDDTGRVPVASANDFGPLGEIFAITFHHSAGPRARTKQQAIELHRAYQLAHMNKGWGDIGYHWSMDNHGRFYRLRPVAYKGAHVGGHNTGNVGIMLHGNYVHDELSRDQRDSLRWLFQGGFLKLTGEPERGIALVRGHQEWPGHASNACPGEHLMRHVRYLRNHEL